MAVRIYERLWSFFLLYMNIPSADDARLPFDNVCLNLLRQAELSLGLISLLHINLNLDRTGAFGRFIWLVFDFY
jgi:hypothetical protein